MWICIGLISDAGTSASKVMVLITQIQEVIKMLMFHRVKVFISSTLYLFFFFISIFFIIERLFLFSKLLWWWQWWDYEVSVFSFSTASPHGLLPPLSFYSLLLGDASLSPNVTQAKTPLSSFARANYPGNTAIPPLLFYTHLLLSLIPPNSSLPPPHTLFLSSLCWTLNLFLEHRYDGEMWVMCCFGFQLWQVQLLCVPELL